ncbi:synaptic vesicle glycoprotein 2C-like isoform X2 [Ctenocephalides felis]|uniref:synaptic vesicle glycoprotein 2C-like isoform X2 n=1 Tax=Ctenocephalides felis TaxID=7515 RepID=UPI000E6E58D3|nr:synaptic vesicle glycoprotein 2C-like isoform X2 [Ctenocephalides felis]
MNNLAFEYDRDGDLENGKRKDIEVTQSATFEEAVAVAGTGKFHIFILFTTGFCMAGVITESLGMSFVLPSADCDLNMTLNEKGLLSASAFLGLVLSAHMWGFLADTRGRKFVMRLSLSIALVCSWISSLSHQAWLLTLMRFLTGFLVSGASSTAYAYLGEFHGDKTRARAISWGASFISMGMVFLPAIAWGIIPLNFRYPIPGLGIDWTAWRLYVLICSLPNLLGLIMIITFPETPKFLLATGKTEEALDVLARMYASNKGRKPSDFPIKSLDISGVSGNLAKAGNAREIASLMIQQTVPLFKKPLVKYTLLICIVQFGMFASSSGMFMWFPVIANDLMSYYDKFGHYDDVCTVFASRAQFLQSLEDKCDIQVNPSVFTLTLILGVCFSMAYITVGIVINILGNKNILIFGLTLCGSCGIAVYFAKEYYVLVSLFGVFLAAGVCVGLMNTITVDVFPTHVRAMALCLSLMIGRLGASAGSNGVGYMLEYKCDGVFFVFGGILLLCAFLTIFIPRKRPEKSVTTQEANSVDS